MFRRSDRPAAPDEATLSARNAATQAFLALDDEQRAVADAVRIADELGEGRPLGPEWAQVSATCDSATEAYLNATQRFPLDGTAPVAGAKAADEKALRDIKSARQTITRFRAQHARPLDHAAMLLRNLPAAVQEARVALVDARSAVAAAATAGVPSRRAADRLAEAEHAAALLDLPGPLLERSERARQTLELARSAMTLATDAPKTAASVRSALRSVATRREATLTKMAGIAPALSALRREFSEPCSRDLVNAERDARTAVTTAEAGLAEATRLAERGEWDDAADAIAAARGKLGEAENQQDAVTSRLDRLRAVRADPARHAAEVRFVLRDAQRLVVDRGLVARFGAILDAQSVRLENACDRLTGVHPDYWLYLSELGAVRDRVKAVVADVRTLAAQPRRP